MEVADTSLWVSMPIIRNIVMASAKNEAEIKSICRNGNIQTSDLKNANSRLTLGQNCAIMDAALHISGDEFLGLHIGEKTSPTVLGITGHLMQSSKDVLTALMNLQQFTKTFTKLYEFRIDIKDNVVYYYCEPIEIWNDLSPDTARHSVDICFAGALHILRLLTGHIFRPIKVLYRYPRIANVSEHERILKCRPLFNQSNNCILFSLKDVSLPIVGYNKELHKVLKNMLEIDLLKKEKQLTFSDQVKHIILNNYHFSFPLLEDVATLMNITARTLQRKLQEEQTTFRNLEDEIKKEIAINLLNNSQLSIKAIGLKLGYADRSSFQRAFKQWTGKTPSKFKKQKSGNKILSQTVTFLT